MLSQVRSPFLVICVLLNGLLCAKPQAQGGDCRGALHDLQGLKVGMARRDLERFFVVAGGMTFRNHTSYVYRDCEYLRVDVDFKIDDQAVSAFSTEDKITGMSQIMVAYPTKD
jgi:hypothetical protein